MQGPKPILQIHKFALLIMAIDCWRILCAVYQRWVAITASMTMMGVMTSSTDLDDPINQTKGLHIKDHYYLWRYAVTVSMWTCMHHKRASRANTRII